jgi:hypothetical protein
MSSLTNSTRKLYKTTLSSPKNDPLPPGYADFYRAHRSAEKINLVYQLSIRPEEIGMIRSVVKERRGQSKSDMLAALDTVRDIVNDPSPAKTLKYGPRFKNISEKILVELGKDVGKVREAISSEMNLVLSDIIKKYGVSAKPSGSKVKSAKAKSIPPVGNGSSGIAGSSESMALAKLYTSILGDGKRMIPKNVLKDAVSWAIDNDKGAIKKLTGKLAYDIIAANSGVSLSDQIVGLVEKSKSNEENTRIAIAAYENIMKIQPVGRLHL